jgi:hypothetical protein
MKTIKPLVTMPYAQARVITEDNLITLQSYATAVIIIDKASGWVQCTGTYSQTTRRHISAFCEEITNGTITYPLMKQIAKDRMLYNLYTGEIVEMDTIQC